VWTAPLPREAFLPFFFPSKAKGSLIVKKGPSPTWLEKNLKKPFFLMIFSRHSCPYVFFIPNSHQKTTPS
jgi:hypothetical protein